LSLPWTFPKLSLTFLLRFRLEAWVENVLLSFGPYKTNNAQSGPGPCPGLFQNGALHFWQSSGWEPEWKMCFPSPGHRKSTMSSQAPYPALNFSKIVLCISVNVQVGSLSRKHATLPRPIKINRCLNLHLRLNSELGRRHRHCWIIVPFRLVAD
jgi:hypothetical protein